MTRQGFYDNLAHMSKSRLVWLVLISLLALVLRWRAALLLPVDYAEPAITSTAAGYASLLSQRDLPGLLSAPDTAGGPSLVKLLYAAAYALRGTTSADLAPARAVSVCFGTLQVALPAWLNPLAGFLLAVHTLAIKYTAQAYLEAVPGFWALLAVLAAGRITGPGDTTGRYGLLSALAAGAAAASNYRYVLPIVSVFLVLATLKRQRPWPLIFWACLAALTFWLLNLQLWANPLGSLRAALGSGTYWRSGTFAAWYAQLLFLWRPVPWHPGVFLFRLDTAICLFSLLGLPLVRRRSPAAAVWMALGIAWLILWPSPWPEQAVVVTVPLCLAAGLAVTQLAQWLTARVPLVGALRPFVPDEGVTLALGLMALGLLVLGTYLQSQYEKEMLSWTYISTASSALPSNTVRALARDAEGHVWAGTEAGASRFDNGTWTTFDTTNSSLPHNLVRAIATEPSGRVWFGTDRGLALLYGQEWSSLSLPAPYEDDTILCMATLPARLDADPAPGPLWVGTNEGALYYDGTSWTVYTPDNSGLTGATVLTIVPDSSGRVWFGTWGGLSLLDGTTWTTYTSANSGLIYDTVSAVVLDAQGRVWCGTLAGISVLDHGSWRSYTLANSALRFNTATRLAIDTRGNVWMGGDLPVGPMGAAAAFDGEKWTDYSQFFTGPHPAPVRAILTEPGGTVWFGTLLEGIVVYDPAAAERTSTVPVSNH